VEQRQRCSTLSAHWSRDGDLLRRGIRFRRRRRFIFERSQNQPFGQLPQTMNLLLIILILLLIGGGGYGFRSGNHYVGGGASLLVIILLVLLLTGRI
jgi:hypothetical protein